ncbi:MAG: CinA family protein [Demequinaceae bacterium]|nr:CinA family protein [Demequinaceae bacterium]
MDPHAEKAVLAARAARLTIATAESLTGGLVAAALTSVPGSSEVFLGGVVAYDTRVKVGMLGVDERLFRERGPVSEEVALEMAEGVRATLGSDVAVATTGVAGPESHGGRPPGTVCVAAVGRGRKVSTTLAVQGDRAAVRREAVAGAIVALVTILQPEPSGGTSVE